MWPFEKDTETADRSAARARSAVSAVSIGFGPISC